MGVGGTFYRKTKDGLKKTKTKAMVDKEVSKQNDKVENIALSETKLGMSKIDALVAYDKLHQKYTDEEIKKEDFIDENKLEMDYILKFLLGSIWNRNFDFLFQFWLNKK